MCTFLKNSVLVLFSIILWAKVADSCKGCVNLDEYNFNKIISRFKVALVKFDMAYPYGENHDVFTKFAEDIADNKNLIVAEVGVKDYGEKENEKLAKKYGIQSKDEFPVMKLFVNGVTNEAKTFPKIEKWNVEMIRNFVKDNSDIYIGLPGCLERMDQLAGEFVKTDSKEEKYKEIEKEIHSLVEREKDIATTYLKYMKKVLSDGIAFIKQETVRLKKLLKETKIQEKKKQDLSNRLNILRSFQELSSKDEL